MNITPPTYSLTHFLNDDIFELLGLESLSDTDKASYIATMRDTVVARTYATILDDYLDKDEADTLNHMPAGDFFEYLKGKGVPVLDILINESARYRAEIVAQFRIATSTYDQLLQEAVQV